MSCDGVLKVLVTGGAGYLGSRVVGHLLETGAEVTVLDRMLFGGAALLPLLDHPRLHILAGDVRDEGMVKKALNGNNAVVHMAAIVGDDACKVSAGATKEINTDATARLADAARKNQIDRFLFISTCSNYGVSDPDSLADETTKLPPLSLYAETKIAAENAVMAVSGGGPAFCVLRFGTICGLSSRMRFNLLVNDMARAAALGEPIEVFTPEAWRPFLHIRDAACAIRHLLSAPSTAMNGEIFNVVSENLQKKQLIEMVRKHFPAVKVSVTVKKTDLRDYRVSAKKIETMLDLKPQASVENAFLEMSQAVSGGFFKNPKDELYTRLPGKEQLETFG